MAFLEIKNLSFSYPNCNEKVLEDISFSVNEGELCLVLGKSGSGKSTLLRLLKKETAPCGNAVGNIKISTENIGFVNQNAESNIVTDTVSGELAFALENRGESREKTALKIAETASYFNFGSIYNDKTDSLSGGTKQLLALASTVISNPRLLIFDEPYSQLDPLSAESIINTVLKLNREQGITILISAHSVERLMPIADKIIYLENKGASVFGSADDFISYILENESDFKAVLPSYTQVINGAPADFITAKRNAGEIKIKENNSSDFFDKETALTAKNICFAYGRRQNNILSSLSFSAYKGKINAVVGSNGCGKTTLLKVLSGIYKPYSGKIRAHGKVCYMPQNVKTMFLCDTVFDELDGDEVLLKQFLLDRLKYRSPFDLSGGEEHRLALAKIIKADADIILLDEPTKGVDACFKEKLAEMFQELCRQGKTIVLVTHDLELAGRYADYVSFLFDGFVTAFGERRKFFGSLDMYTTALSRLTDGKAVSIDDVKGVNE